MPFVRKFRLLRRLWAVSRYLLFGLIFIAGLGSLWWWLANLGPRSIEGSATVVRTVSDPAIDRLSREIEKLETNYRNVADSGIVTDQAQTWLAEALVKQRELVRLSPQAGYDQMERLRRLEAESDGVRVRRINVRIEQLTRDGAEALEAGREEAGGALLEEALTLQREVNGTDAVATLKNFQRETVLRQQLDGLAAAPMAREAAAALEVARDAAARESWSAALAAYVQARDMQRRINAMYPRTRYADIMEVDRLEREISSLNAGGIASEITEAERQGDALLEAGEHAEAARRYAEAQARQVEVNQQFPRSRFVSSPRVEELEVKKQSALSAPRWEKVREMETEIAQLLRRRQVVGASQQIARAGEMVAELFRTFPKSLRLDNALRIKLAYLQLREEDLRDLQDEVYRNLVPLPAAPGRAMFRTEIPQALYARVMNANPSRHPGRNLPVDSLSWSEAREFCQRLGWLLGKPVRLPTVDEFRIAIGDAQSGSVWSTELAARESQEIGTSNVNENGYQDLLGNVAEWLDTPGPGDGQVMVGGGSYLESEKTLRAVPLVPQAATERARHFGFRVVVLDET